MTGAPVASAVAARTAGRSPEWLRAARRARALSWFSLAYMGAEGGVAVLAAVLSGSVALLAFGIDSFIEGVASLVIVWRFSGGRLHSEAAESRAQKLVALQFFILAPYIAFEALQALVLAERPDVSALGMALTASSMVVMPALGIAKQRLARTLGSTATRGEGTQNLLCAYLAAAVFVGLAGNAVAGLWWLDPLAALLIAAVAVREGLETWRGEGCCSPEPLAAAIDGEPTELPIVACRLDPAGLHAQRERYRELGRHVAALDRLPGALEVEFAPGLDLELLERTLAIERECCPFFGLELDRATRRLSVSVQTAEQEPALAAIADALTGR